MSTAWSTGRFYSFPSRIALPLIFCTGRHGFNHSFLRCPASSKTMRRVWRASAIALQLLYSNSHTLTDVQRQFLTRADACSTANTRPRPRSQSTKTNSSTHLLLRGKVAIQEVRRRALKGGHRFNINANAMFAAETVSGRSFLSRRLERLGFCIEKKEGKKK